MKEQLYLKGTNTDTFQHTNSVKLSVYAKQELRQIWQPSFIERSQSQHGKLEKDDLYYRQKEKEFLVDTTDLTKDQIFFLKQEHSSVCHLINKESIKKNKDKIYYAKGDALYTQDANLLLVIRTADCLPFFVILEFSKKKEKQQTWIALIHAGWRGLQKNIIYNCLMQMFTKCAIALSELSSLKLRCFSGPYAGRSRYEVGADVASIFPDAIQNCQDSNRHFLDLGQVAKKQIQDALKSYTLSMYRDASVNQPMIDYLNQIHYCTTLKACTISDNQRFFSHRCKDQGRNLNAIYL